MSADGWWMLATVLWVGGCLGLLRFGQLYRRRAPQRLLGPDPRPPALHVRRRPPYDWARDGG